VTHTSTRPAWSRDLGSGALAIIAVSAASFVGQLATYPNLAPWYAGLAKPSFNPPNWVFAPVWTTLYVLMAFAVWRILRLPQVSAARRLALSLFFIQLALNAAWSWMFFGAKSAARPDQHRSANLGHSRHRRRVPSARQDGGLVSCAACGLGCLCGRSQCRDLAIKWLIDGMP